MSVNRLDRHVDAGNGDKVAYHFEGEPGDTRTITYANLLADVERFANVLKGSAREGDRVAIYMPMIPELPVAMLASRASGSPTPSSSAGSPRRHHRPVSTPMPASSSPPTPATAAASRRC
ncbi:MAG: AMP-binding protein [Acidimicrobiales bacterium]